MIGVLQDGDIEEEIEFEHKKDENGNFMYYGDGRPIYKKVKKSKKEKDVIRSKSSKRRSQFNYESF